MAKLYYFPLFYLLANKFPPLEEVLSKELITVMPLSQGWQLKKTLEKTNSQEGFLCFIEILVKRQINEIIVWMSLFYIN